METREMVKLTFKPLSRGWYRCNQTDEKTKNCERYRNSHPVVRPREIPKLKSTEMACDNEWRCPACHRKNWNGVLNKVNECHWCFEKVVIDKQLSEYIF